MRFLSVCSGMEAASVAWEPLGWKAVGFSEIEPFPCAILKHRFPNTPNYGSLTEYQSWPLAIGDVDLLCGGTPCQSYSVAGKRGGLNDPRGQLMLSFLDLASKLQPKYILWENVPGVLSSGQPRGADFATFLQGLVERGYGWAYRVLDAQYVGRCGLHSQGQGWDAVPQRRRRVFVVACRGAGGWESAASVLLKPESLCWHPAKGRKKGQATAADARSGVEAGSPVVIDRAAFNQGENAQYEPHIEQTDVMDSLVARGPHAVACATGDITHCLTASSGKGATEDGTGRGAPIVNAITFQPGNLRREAGADPSTTTTTTTTLKASAGDQMPHVAHPVVPLDGMNLLSRLGDCGENHSMQNFDDGDPQFTLRKGGVQHGVLTPMAVRRLTPTECERLQGFPDNWSRIPWKGKPEDQCPDGPRYKACGNSMAVPCMRWIGEQIARVELSHNPTNQTNA